MILSGIQHRNYYLYIAQIKRRLEVCREYVKRFRLSIAWKSNCQFDLLALNWCDKRIDLPYIDQTHLCSFPRGEPKGDRHAAHPIGCIGGGEEEEVIAFIMARRRAARATLDDIFGTGRI